MFSIVYIFLAVARVYDLLKCNAAQVNSKGMLSINYVLQDYQPLSNCLKNFALFDLFRLNLGVV